MITAGDLPLMSVVGSNSTLMHVEVVESVKGSAPFVNEVQRLTVEANLTSPPTGTFAISFGRDQTSPLPVIITATDLAVALEALPSLRGGVNVRGGTTHGAFTWTVTFVSPGPQAMLRSSCQETVEADLSPDCLLQNATTVEIRRVVKGSSPASGTFRLKLVPVDDNTDQNNAVMAGISSTAPLPTDATAEEVQAALVGLIGGEKATVTIAPHPGAEYGFQWALALHDNDISSVKIVDVNIDGPGPWCVDGNTGPAAAETPCEFPFSMDEDDVDVHFSCTGAGGASLGWCSSSPTFDESRDWGGCVRCAEGALSLPAMHVASLRRSFRLRGITSQVSQALSEVIYHPRPLWNSWVGGHDEVSAYLYHENSERLTGATARTVSQVFVAPVNDPPTASVTQRHRITHEGKELLLQDADIWDPDLAERSQIVVRVLLEADLGTLALGDPSGLTFLSGTPEPHSSGRLVITGPVMILRAALQHLYYRPPNGLGAGAAAATVRVTREVQRLELMSPVSPMVQSIATSALKGYISGNFTLSLNCGAFFEALDDYFFPDTDIVNSTRTPVVLSSQFAADAPATGNGSVEIGVRTMLTDCVSLAWDYATLLSHQINTTSSINSSFAGNVTDDFFLHRAATAVVSRGEPDLHGSLTWAITLVGVPESFPLFEVGANNLTNTGAGLEDSPYSYDESSSSAEGVSVTIAAVQPSISSSGPSGTFTLTAKSGGQETEPILASASDEDLAAALTVLPDIGAIQVSTGPLLTQAPAVPAWGRYWEVTFLPSGFPVHVGDISALVANGAGLEGAGADIRVSEVAKGQAPATSVRVTVNDLGNVGDGEPLEATAMWNITIVPEAVSPVVHVNETTDPMHFLRALGGTVLSLPPVQISHAVAWDTEEDNASQTLQYLVQLRCSRGSVKPASSAMGEDVLVRIISSTVTVLSGTLPDLNRALSNLDYYSPRRYRGVDDIEIASRLAGLGVDGDWGTAKLYVFVDGVNNAPELAVPRSLRTTGASSSAVGGISLTDDDMEGNVTVTVEAARGLVSFPTINRLQSLDAAQVRACTIYTLNPIMTRS